MLNLMWFRSDLRIGDNPALHTAMQQGPTIAVYFITPGQWNEHHDSAAKRSLLKGQLKKLAEQLNTINVPLKIIRCERFTEIPAHIGQLVDELDISQLFFNHEYPWNEMHCSRSVVKSLRNKQIKSTGLHDQCLVQPGKITNGQGGCYKVYSAFKRAFIANFNLLCRDTYPRPSKQKKLDIDDDLTALQQFEVQWSWQLLWPAGEEEAHQRLNQFLQQPVKEYHRCRDLPGVKGTSSLSPYLTVGAISTSQCLHAALSLNQGEFDSGEQGTISWINELIWREFYRHLLVAYPDLSRHQPFKSDTDRLPWSNDNDLFEAWCQGKTGFPIVDAAMRQLTSTGWMHNRLRMITAMFLSKHLFIDWRLGERFFMQHLVDGDLASNNGGWQWSASTGVDAVPYFRIFNPTRQSLRFDPEGDFIRQFVPELNHLDNKSIHQPSRDQAQQAGYYQPMVEHRSAVEQTKHYFKQLNEQSRQWQRPTELNFEY